MDESWGEGKRTYEYEVEEEEDVSYGEDGKKKRVVNEHHVRKVSRGGGSVTPSCQVDNCNADLSGGKQYHKRHKVCENHSKAHSVLISEMQQRFCQQCSRFTNPNLFQIIMKINHSLLFFLFMLCLNTFFIFLISPRTSLIRFFLFFLLNSS